MYLKMRAISPSKDIVGPGVREQRDVIMNSRQQPSGGRTRYCKQNTYRKVRAAKPQSGSEYRRSIGDWTRVA